MLAWPAFLAILGLLFSAAPAVSDTPVALYESLAGNINITGTGGTLRTNMDGVNSCSVTNSGTMTLSGIPAGATVRTAYLYWAGSGGDPQGGVGPDYNVTFNGTAVTADRTYTAWYLAGFNLYFFSGVKDVTSLVTGNGNYTFADLTVQNTNVPGGGQYCANAAVLSAYSLLVIYDDPAEALHVVNIWEGFQTYRGASITLTPTNFQVPTPAPVTALSSRILLVTWEGDSGNSGALGGFTENLTFCSPTPCAGVALTDAYNPLNNQFNSTVDIPPSGPFSGINTTWGLDMDMYDLTSRLPAGAASAQSVYSSGGDLVILSNQTMAIVNVPVADLEITKSHSGNFTVGQNGVYTIEVLNNGPNSATGVITVTDTLPAGLTYSSATGTGWACGAVGQDVTCTRPGPLANGASAPAISLTVSVGAAAYPSVTNTASVSNPTFDNVAANDSSSDLTTVLAPDLSTSTKTWLDLNGGDQNPTDIIRFTITVIESGGAAASGVSLTDTLPATLVTPAMVSCPVGATCNFAGQTLTATNLSLPASGSVTVVFDATIAGGTPAGTLINNTATITNPAGPGATAVAQTIIVSASSIAQSGNKPLYLYDTTSAPAFMLSRTPMPTTPAAVVTIPRGNNIQAWTLSPALQSSVTITTNVPVELWLSTNNTRTYTIPVTLLCGATTVATQTLAIALVNGQPPTLYTFNLPRGTPYTCAAGNSWVLTVTNTEGGTGGGRNLLVYPAPSAGNTSKAVLRSENVINVDSVSIYNAAYPGGSLLATSPSGTTVYVRSTVSDPFGSYDITAASIVITDSTGTVRVNNAAMTQVFDSGAATKTYQYTYAIPASGPAGAWTFRVSAVEGTEGTVSDFEAIGFPIYIPTPNILTLKSVVVVSDPVNTGPPYRSIPGAVMQYTVTASNQGNGATDAGSVVLVDPIPANTEMFVNDLGLPGSGPVAFANGTPSSGLTYSFINLGSGADSIEFSNTAFPYAYGYTPVPDGNGFDGNVTSIRITLGGAFAFSAGAPYPSFTLQFRVRVK